MESKKINQLATNLAPVSTDLTVVGNPTTGELKKITLLQIASIFGVGIGSIGMVVPSGFSVSPATLTANGTFTISGAGTTAQYIRGDGSLATFPTLLSSDRLIQEVRNNSGATMLKGTIVYINGAVGNKATIAKALATTNALSSQTYGVVQDDIPNNSNGYVVVVGEVTGLDTSAVTEGQQLYLSGTIAGFYTVTKPYAPIHLVYVAVVLRSHPTLGVLGVKIQNGYELSEIHDCAVLTPSNNDGLFYESSTSLWKNKSIATILGYTPVTSARTISTTSPLSGGGDLSANRTLTIAQSTTSVDGYLSATDWNTFNGKQGTITLTTTGTSGAATFISNTLNIPQYAGTNIYNADGTLTSARTVTSGGFNLTFTGSNTAASAIARGLYLTPTLIASANSDVLAALDISPTFTLGAFTGVSSLALRVTGDVTFNTGNITGISSHTITNTISGGTTAVNAVLGINYLNTTTGAAAGSTYGTYSYTLLNITGGSANQNLYGLFNVAVIRGLATNSLMSGIGAFIGVSRTDASDISTNASNNLTSLNLQVSHGSTSGSATIVTGTVQGTLQTISHVAGTITNSFGHQINNTVAPATSSLSSTITNLYGYRVNLTIGAASGGPGLVSNFYGLYLNTPTVGTTGTITNRWGVYAPDSVMKHHINGNVLIGSTTDTGQKLQLTGTSILTGQLTVTGSTTAASLLAQGIIATPTLVAAANSDVLVGLDINPTFTVGAFTGVIRSWIRLGTYSTNGTSNTANIDLGASYSTTAGQNLKLKLFNSNSGSASDIYGFGVSAGQLDYHSGGGNHGFWSGGTPTKNMQLFSTGNLLVQNGGTFTDGGQRLQVTGTSILNGFATISGSTTAASAIARGALVSSTLVAAANSDVLVGLDINPTFTNGAFTGVTNIGFRSLGSINQIGTLPAQPTAVLHVGGTIRLADTASINNGSEIKQNSNQLEIRCGATSGAFLKFVTGSTAYGSDQFSMQMTYNFGGGASYSGFVFGTTTRPIAYQSAYGFAWMGSSNSQSIFSISSTNNNVGINTNSPVVSAQLEMTSTTQGFLPPRMTTTQKNAIATPATGLVVFDSTLGKLCVRTASAWETITSV